MSKEPENRRAFIRHAGKAETAIVREKDPKRSPVRGLLDDISSSGVALLLPIQLDVGEYVTVELANPLQRATVQLRTCVRHVEPGEEGWYRVGCSLMNRLTSREVEGFRQTSR